MSTTTADHAERRADALIALGGFRELSVRLAEMTEELHAKTSGLESFVESVFFQVDADDGELQKLFETVKKRLQSIDRFETLALHEAAAKLADAVEAEVMKERVREVKERARELA